MISYSLKCAEGHQFDSWFQSAAAYDKLARSGMVSCAVCGSTDVEKTLMAPQVRASDKQTEQRPLAPQTQSPEQQAALKALAELKKTVQENSEYVGGNFSKEARAMHDGLKPERSIYGEARPEEARKLAEDGIPVMPLPFLPDRKTN